MKTSTLTLETLHLFSPGLAADFMDQLEAAIRDCRQRPSLGQKREVCLRLSIVPHPEDADDVLILPATTTRTPTRKLDTVRARRTVRNQLQFDFDEETEQ